MMDISSSEGFYTPALRRYKSSNYSNVQLLVEGGWSQFGNRTKKEEIFKSVVVGNTSIYLLHM